MALRWGFVCASKICSDFAACLRSLPEAHEIVAVAARDIDRAKAFADVHGIPQAYQGYERIAEDPYVDIAYIGSLHNYHYELALLMLQHGKHVLCEKPLCLTETQAKHVIAEARKKNVFFMEAVWSRFFPAYQKIREIIASGQLGQVKLVLASFGDYNIDVERVRTKATGGGAILDVGIYNIQLASMVYGQQPTSVSANGYLLDTGVDGISSIVLKYPNNTMAVLNSSIMCDFPNEAYIMGERKKIKICCPLWSPTRIEISEAEKIVEVHEFPLPDIKWDFNFRNQSGMQYMATAVGKYIKEGAKESPIMSHDESILLAGIMDKARHGLGYYFDDETPSPSL
ncbi:trans-1,2-dihydrobenzene-1,2-diol dehydrogenase-like [Amphiura filiformis]|uniref:trans-1,2-dihydrobenzene-1,2-diol dehydrogenase-like n=1 Tax=Amphiura filiformis TaxID=82378 RepID=UPI003B20BB1F